MSGQYGLTKEQQRKVLVILAECGIQLTPYEKTKSDDGKYRPFHRDISIHVCDYEDESEEFDMYIQTD